MAFYKSKERLEVATDGFHGVYWENPAPAGAAMIAMLGDDAEDMLAKGGAKWLVGLGMNALTMSPEKHDYGHHNYPLERFEAAIAWLRAHGNEKIGIAGASTTGMLALVAASRLPSISLTLAFTPSDFVWQGFCQGKRDGCDEWPVEGESTVSYHGEPLPYMRFCYQHPEYWHKIKEETKSAKSMIASRRVFDDSERVCGVPDEAFIRVEDIKGRLVLVGAADDVLWDTVRYIRRMEARLAERPHDCEVEVLTYDHGGHFVFPESMLHTILPVGADAFCKLAFLSEREHPAESHAAREDIDAHVRAAFAAWLAE